MKRFVTALLLAVAATTSAAATAAADDDADVAAIKQRAVEYVAAYNQHDAAALAKLWDEHAVYLNRDTGEPIEGREAIGKMFQEMFESGEASQLGVTIQSIRLITPDVAIEDGTAEITPTEGEVEQSTYTAIHVKRDGGWYLNSVRETDMPAAPPREPNELDQLAWLIGDWVDDAEDAAVHTNWRWAKNEHFLTSNFSVSVDGEIEMEGTQVIGWDAANQQIRSWVFDSEGGFGEGVWRRVGDEWIVDSTTTLEDGAQGKATNVYKPIDNDSFTWKSVDRQIDGEVQPDVDEIAVRRQVAVASSEAASSQDTPEVSGGN
jgi:uncharacterized protein (TIGR02246 family)